MTVALLSVGLAIIAAEAILWRLFRRKITDMHFPESMDTSSIATFSLYKMRSAAVAHGILLLLSTLIPLWLLW